MFWRVLSFSLFLSLIFTLAGGAAATGSATEEMASAGEDLLFVENVGQFDPAARFQVLGSPITWVTEDSLWVTLVERAPDELPGRNVLSFPRTFELEKPQRSAQVRISFPGTSSQRRLEPFNPVGALLSYFYGRDPAGWHSTVPVWAGLRYRDLYPGVDLEIQAEEGELAMHLVCRAECAQVLPDVRLRVEGAEGVVLAEHSLQVTTVVGSFRLPLLHLEGGRVAPKPAIQRGSGEDVEVLSPFTLLPSGESSGKPPAPALLYSTFFGGSVEDWVSGLHVDKKGAVYLAGTTASLDFPSTPGSYGTSGDNSSFVAKFSPDLTRLVYAAFIAGNSVAGGLAVDKRGSAYLTGTTLDCDFPVTPGAFDTVLEGCDNEHDAFVVKLSQDGTRLEYSTLLGREGDEFGSTVVVDASGTAYAAGESWGGNFPVTPGAFDLTFENYDIFLARLNDTGSDLIFATYLGGSDDDVTDGDFRYELVFALALDHKKNIYLAGSTTSPDFPVTSQAYDRTINGNSDVFVTKFKPDGSGLVYSTLLGGESWDEAYAVAVDVRGAAYIGGYTNSFGFPLTPGAVDTFCEVCDGWSDGFLAGLDPTGSALTFSTYLGGGQADWVNSLVLDQKGNVWASGDTISIDFPTTAGALDESHDGYYDGFVVQLAKDGTRLMYGSYWGGQENDLAGLIAIGRAGTVYIAGGTYSPDLMITDQAFDSTYNGDLDIYLAILK
jgi:hypothetical protein